MYLFHRLLKFVYSSFLKTRKFLLAVTGAILAYSRDTRRWGLIRWTHHSNNPPFSPISKCLSVDLPTENIECSYTASFLCPPFVELELFLLDYPSTMVFPHAWKLFSRTTVTFSLHISSAIILSYSSVSCIYTCLIVMYYCQTCEFVVPFLAFDLAVLTIIRLLLNSWVLWWQVIQKKEKISSQKGVGVSPAQGSLCCNLCMRLTKWAAEQQKVCGRSGPTVKIFLKVQAKF